MGLWWSKNKRMNWSSWLSGDKTFISTVRGAAIHWVSPLQCVNSTVNHYQYQSSVTLHSNKSHLARVDSLQPSNIPLIVRCFQAQCQVGKKRPFTVTQPRLTYCRAQARQTHTLCTNTYCTTVLKFMANIASQSVSSKVRHSRITLTFFFIFTVKYNKHMQQQNYYCY